MKKYTQPTVEITAFDFEDIICDSSLGSACWAANKAEFEAAKPTDVVVVEW